MQGYQNTFTLGPKAGKVLFGTPTCTPLTFQGGTVPNTRVVRGTSYTLTCDYGAVVETILAYSGGNASRLVIGALINASLEPRHSSAVRSRQQLDLH